MGSLEFPLWLRLTIPQVSAILLTVFGTLSLSRFLPKWAVGVKGIAAVFALIALLVACSVFIETREQNRRRARLANLTAYVVFALDQADGLVYKLERDLSRPEAFPEHRDGIQRWRTGVSEYLERQLPESGAALRFRGATGQVVVGNPMIFEFSRINLLRSNLGAIFDHLDSYLDRSMR